MSRHANGNQYSSLHEYLLRKPIDTVVLLEASCILERYQKNKAMAIQYVEDMHKFCLEQSDKLLEMIKAVKPHMSEEFFNQFRNQIGSIQLTYWADQCKHYSELKRALKQ